MLMPFALTILCLTVRLCIHNTVLSSKLSAIILDVACLVQGHVHRSWVQAQTLLSPVFDNLASEQKHLTLLQQVLHIVPPQTHHELISCHHHLPQCNSQQAVLRACMDSLTLKMQLGLRHC